MSQFIKSERQSIMSNKYYFCKFYLDFLIWKHFSVMWPMTLLWKVLILHMLLWPKNLLKNVKEKNYTTSFYTLNLDLFANIKNYFEYWVSGIQLKIEYSCHLPDLKSAWNNSWICVVISFWEGLKSNWNKWQR